LFPRTGKTSLGPDPEFVHALVRRTMLVQPCSENALGINAGMLA
jgi:hypothetical protein